MDTLIREHSWFLVFWGMIVLLGTLEVLFPQFQLSAHRKRRWPTNFGLGILNGLLICSLPAFVVLSAQWAENNGIGLLNWLSAPWWIAVLATLLVRSLAGYGFHVISHKVPLLWRLHRVHHCDVHLDVSSALRAHPLELVIMLVFMLPVVTLFGLSAVALAVYESVEVIANMVTHANIRLPKAAERYAGYVVVTPSVHRLHHSSLQIETDSNYGNVFSFWDRLFATYRSKAFSDETFRFGLDEVSRERAGSFDAQLRLPFTLPGIAPPQPTPTVPGLDGPKQVSPAPSA
jgi:sterol desaturase/sphingolipid hydroxylase (fatty acid hydroxylase superfamily)